MRTMCVGPMITYVRPLATPEASVSQRGRAHAMKGHRVDASCTLSVPVSHPRVYGHDLSAVACPHDRLGSPRLATPDACRAGVGVHESSHGSTPDTCVAIPLPTRHSPATLDTTPNPGHAWRRLQPAPWRRTMPRWETEAVGKPKLKGVLAQT